MGIETAKTHFEKNLLPMLEEGYNQGIIEFKLRMFNSTSFYIHPYGKDGKTINIDWSPSKEPIIDINVDESEK